MNLLLPLPWLLMQAVSLGQPSLPGSGTHETTLTLDAPATVHLSARGASGTSCEVIDRVRGPFARAGVTGKTNCELDLLLDAGEYKVRVESPKNGKGTVNLTASAFTELSASPAALEPGSSIELTLKPGQQVSTWLSMPVRGVPYVRVSGRNAGDVRLWRQGEWIEPIRFTHSVVMNTPGYPQHEWWLDSVVEEGEYRLVVYGRDAAQVTGSTQDDSLTIEHGFRSTPPERAVNFTLPVSGLMAVELPRLPTAAFVSTRQQPEGPVSLQLAALAPLAPLVFNNTCIIPKGALVPECGVNQYSTPERRIAFVRGPRGTKGTLEWAQASSGSDLGWLSSASGAAYGSPTTALSFGLQTFGKALVGAHDLPVDLDGPPLGCQLETAEGATTVLARSATTLNEGEALEKDFNLSEGGAVIWFSITSANRYRVKTGTERKTRCEVYKMLSPGKLERLTKSNANDAPGCEHVLQLGPGDYQLQLVGNLPGIEHLSIAVDGAKSSKPAVVKSACQLPPVQLSRGRYRLTLTRSGTLARGLVLNELPIDVRSGPVHVTLEGRETMKLPLASRVSTLSVSTTGGATFGCTIPGGTMVTTADCKVPAAGQEELVLTNPNDRAVQLTIAQELPAFRQPSTTPFTPRPKALTTVVPEKPVWFDFDRNQAQVALFEVKEAGLYNATTLGLLATSCRLRTPVIDRVAENSHGGRGRNCLIQAYLQPGRYLMSATTVGQSRGRGALFLTRRAPRDATGIGGEGEVFFRAEANELVQQKLTVTKSGSFRLDTTAQATSLSCRLDDPKGWPVEVVPSPCSNTRELAAGQYVWTQYPLTVESMRHTKLERVREPVVLKGNRPHAISAFTWYDAELGADGKDEFTFTLEGETTLDFVVTQAMQGRIYRLEKDQQPKVVEVLAPQAAETIDDSGDVSEDAPYEPPPDESEGESESEYGGMGTRGRGYHESSSREETVATGRSGPEMRAAPSAPSGARVTLPAGSYKLVTEHSRGDVGISYRLHFGGDVMMPGMSRELPVPTMVSLVVPRDGTLRLETKGEADVRCRLFDASNKLVLEGKDNGPDWNCALAEPLPRGTYRLVVESETQLAGQTRLSVSLPPVDDKGAFAAGQKLSLTTGVTQLTIPAGDVVHELSVKATGKTPFSCALVGPRGVAARVSRGTECAVAIVPRTDAWTLRLWTTDGSSAVTTALSTTPATATTVPRAGTYKTAAGTKCLSGTGSGVLTSCGPETSLEAGPAVFATATTLNEVVLDAASNRESRTLTRSANLQRLTAPSRALFLQSITTAWGEPAPPACAFDGPGTLNERRATSCFAVSHAGTEATARAWTTSDTAIPSTLVRRAVSIPTATALTTGRKRASFTTAAAFTLPAPRARVELTLAPGAWAVLVDANGNATELCAPDEQLKRCIVTGQGELVLVGDGQAQAELTTIVLENAPAPIAFTGLYEDAPRMPGTVRLSIPLSPIERALHIDGAVRCTTSLSTGERITDCETTLPARVSAELIIEHGVTALRVIASTPGRERWATLGIEVPTGSSPALAPAVAVPLTNGKLDRTLTLTESGVARVTVESGVCGLFRGNDLLAVSGNDTGCELIRVLTPGTYRLLVRPFAQRPLGGSARWLIEPVATLTEGVGAETWLGPGETRLFTFETKAKGRVGLGLQSKTEQFDCVVLNDGYQLLGEGCQQYLSLERGRFLLIVRNPNRPNAAPASVKPVVLGLSGDTSPVPDDYVMDLFRRVGVSQ